MQNCSKKAQTDQPDRIEDLRSSGTRGGNVASAFCSRGSRAGLSAHRWKRRVMSGRKTPTQSASVHRELRKAANVKLDEDGQFLVPDDIPKEMRKMLSDVRQEQQARSGEYSSTKAVTTNAFDALLTGRPSIHILSYPCVTSASWRNPY